MAVGRAGSGLNLAPKDPNRFPSSHQLGLQGLRIIIHQCVGQLPYWLDKVRDSYHRHPAPCSARRFIDGSHDTLNQVPHWYCLHRPTQHRRPGLGLHPSFRKRLPLKGDFRYPPPACGCGWVGVWSLMQGRRPEIMV